MDKKEMTPNDSPLETMVRSFSENCPVGSADNSVDLTTSTAMVKDNIILIVGKHLERLSKAGSEEFISALCKLEPPRGYDQIQRKDLEGKTAMEMAEFIMKIYTNRFGPGKIRNALKNIHENQIRTDLQKELKGAARMSGGPASGAESGGATGCMPGTSQQPADIKPKGESKTKEKPTVKVEASGGAADRKQAGEEKSTGDVKPKQQRHQETSDEEHFVNRNQNDLIKPITNVEPDLVDLFKEKLLIQEQYDTIREDRTTQAKMPKLYNYVRSWLGLEEKDTVLDILEKHNPVVIKNLLEKPKKKKQTPERRRLVD